MFMCMFPSVLSQSTLVPQGLSVAAHSLSLGSFHHLQCNQIDTSKYMFLGSCRKQRCHGTSQKIVNIHLHQHILSRLLHTQVDKHSRNNQVHQHSQRLFHKRLALHSPTPVNVMPSPEYPVKHEQSKEPLVFVQLELGTPKCRGRRALGLFKKTFFSNLTHHFPQIVRFAIEIPRTKFQLSGSQREEGMQFENFNFLQKIRIFCQFGINFFCQNTWYCCFF